MFDSVEYLRKMRERDADPNRPRAGDTADTRPTDSGSNDTVPVPLAIDRIESAPDLLLERELPWC